MEDKAKNLAEVQMNCVYNMPLSYCPTVLLNIMVWQNKFPNGLAIYFMNLGPACG